MKSMLLKIGHLLPDGARRAVGGFGPAARLKRMLFERDSNLHDHYYTEAYFEEDVAGPARRSAVPIRDDMIRLFGPGEVIDVGCGTGDYLEAFREVGVNGHGVDLAEASLRRCRSKGLDVRRHDLTKGEPLPWTADLVYCFEVAEHIDARQAPAFIATLVGAARRHLCLTAAAPGQQGLCHVNCRPKSYWIDLVHARGFAFDEALTERWERDNRSRDLAPWFCRNLMVFHAPGVTPTTSES